MDNSSVYERLDELLTLDHDGIIDEQLMLQYFFIRKGIIVCIKKEREFNYYLESLYTGWNISNLLISKECFCNALIDAYIDYKSGIVCDIISDLKQLEIQEMHVFLPLYYVQIYTDKIEIGRFRFVNFTNLGEYFLSNGLITPPEITDITKDKNFENVPFADIIVSSREYTYAVEQAKVKLEEMVHALNFIVFSHTRGGETISTTTDYGTTDRRFITTENSCSIFVGTHSPAVRRITIEDIDEYLVQEGQEYKEIINTFEKNDKNELEKRIANAVNWSGMAISEKNNSVAFTQAIFAIESLLQYEQSGEVINKSTVASISENIAFLIGKSVDERKGLEKQFKALYRIRSKIAHGKGTDVTTYQVLEAIDLATRLIMELSNNPELREVKTMVGITNYITKLKYTC